jgi:RNA polymerase sigma factor (sigma-70 family)
MPSADRKDLDEFARTGSAEAFGRLAGRYAGLVYGVCRRRLASAEDAEDASQAVFLALARKAGRVRPESLASWLHGAAVRAALVTARAAATRARREEEAARMRSQETTSAGGGEAAWEDLRPQLDAEIGRLPRRLREPLGRHYLAGQSLSEISAETGLPRSTVADRVRTATDKLRTRLSRRGVSLGAAALGELLAANASPAVPQGLVASLPGLASAPAAAAGAAGAAELIAQGVLKMMLVEKIKIAAAGLLVATAVSAAVPATVAALRAAEPAGQPVAGPAPAAPAAARGIKPEWRGKLLAQLTRGGVMPEFSPDGTAVAYGCADPKYVGVLRLADGSHVAAQLPLAAFDARRPPSPRIAWRADGEAVFASAERKVWLVTLGGERPTVSQFAALPAPAPVKPAGPLRGGLGSVHMQPSPGGRFLLCESGISVETQIDDQWWVLDAAGRQTASFKARQALWLGDDSEILIGRRDRVLAVNPADGTEKPLFTSKDCFGGKPPETHGGSAWMPKILGPADDGKLLVDVLNLPTRSLMGSGGFMGPEGVAFTWDRKAGTFTRLGPTSHRPFEQQLYVPFGTGGKLLRAKFARPKDVPTCALQLIDAADGRELGAPGLPAKIRYRGAEVPATYWVLAAAEHSDRLLLEARGRVREQGKGPPPGRPRTVVLGRFVLEAAGGKARPVKLPEGFEPIRWAGGWRWDPSGRLLVVGGHFVTGELRERKVSNSGVWLCAPGGDGTVRMPEPKGALPPHDRPPRGPGEEVF